MDILSVEVLEYEVSTDTYKVKYVLDLGKGLNRKSVAYYSKGKLSRDNDKNLLLEKIKEAVKKFIK